MAVYLDSSALVKLVVREGESTALRRFLRSHPTRTTCGLSRVEVPRAVRAHGPRAFARAKEVLRRLHVLHLNDAILDRAASLDPIVLRSLDAIHLAAALTLESELAVLVTYDERMARAAEAIGMAVGAPA